jgi:site-specific DNA-methyltransferase (adenine-specific)
MERRLKKMGIEPYYSEDGITIYHGDCRDILPELEPVDLVLTDPPYGMSFQSNHRTVKHAKIHGDDSLPIDEIELCIKMANFASYFFCRWDNLDEMPIPKSLLVWVKNNWSMGDLKHEHGRQWEAICFYNGPEHSFIKRIPDVLTHKRTGNNLHPTEKPVKLIQDLIACNEGRTILDPFMGSGTTLVAAKNLRRKAIGIELEEKYCEIAVKRLAQGVLAI